MKTKAIGYVRVSTDKQADRGVSLEAKVEKIEAMATVHDVELLDVLVDAGESAKDLPRVRGPWLQHRGRETLGLIGSAACPNAHETEEARGGTFDKPV